MTVDADLATLRDWIGDPEDYSDEDRGAAERACDACDGVEAELSRLREENAGYARTIVALWEEIAPGESYEELGGATIVELATRLRHTANNLLEGLTVACEEWERDYRAAEARCARLQQMLGAAFRECEDDISVVVCDCDVDPEATCLAHRILALAGPDTPADSPEPREGIVMVYDWQHRYLGCMGVERWQEVLAADSQKCEHDYVYVSRSEDYYRCDKCDQTSDDGVHPRVGADSTTPLPNPRHEYSTELISGRWRGIAEDDFHDEDGYGGDSQPEECLGGCPGRCTCIPPRQPEEPT